MLGRLLEACLIVLVCAVAIWAAVHLIQSVAAPLIFIVAAAGGLMLIGLVIRLLWRRSRMNRW